MDHCGEKHTFGMADADEGELQDAAEAIFGAKIGVIAPGEIGERAGGDAQPRTGGGLARKQLRRPGDQRWRESRHTGQRQANEAGALNQWVAVLLSLLELRVEPALAQSQR